MPGYSHESSLEHGAVLEPCVVSSLNWPLKQEAILLILPTPKDQNRLWGSSLIPSCGSEYHNYFTALPIAWNLLLANTIKRPEWLLRIWSMVLLSAFPGAGFCIRSPLCHPSQRLGRDRRTLYLFSPPVAFLSRWRKQGRQRGGLFRSAWLGRFRIWNSWAGRGKWMLHDEI